MLLTTNDFGNLQVPPFSGINTEQLIQELRDRIDEIERRQECKRCGEVKATLYTNFVDRQIDDVVLTKEDYDSHSIVWLMCEVLVQYHQKLAQSEKNHD